MYEQRHEIERFFEVSSKRERKKERKKRRREEERDLIVRDTR